MLFQEAAAESGVKTVAKGVLDLGGDYSLAHPVAGALALVAMIVFTLWGRSRGGRESASVTLTPSTNVRRSVRQQLAWLPTALQVFAMIFVAIGLARPLHGKKQSTAVSEGVDIVLLIDRSSSMQHEDLAPNRTRLEVVKDVVGEFAVRRMTDREGAADSICIVPFARYPQLLCPFTLDVDAVTGFMSSVSLVRDRIEDGTGIGIALAKAIAVLKETEAESKICVLLTDGENNIDLIAPLDAAELAAEEGIRVYTVLAGRFIYDRDFFNNIIATERELDSTELEQIAAMTDGRFFRAKDKAALEEVYAEIERLERTEREEVKFSEHYDLYPKFLLIAFVLYQLSWIFGSTWLRRLP